MRDKTPEVGREFVEYRRGTRAIERLEVVQGGSDVGRYLVEDQDGTFKSIDWYVDVNDLVVDGVKVEPEVGDEILRTDPRGATQRYRVLPVPGGRHFEIVDERVGMYRIHSKLVDTT